MKLFQYEDEPVRAQGEQGDALATIAPGEQCDPLAAIATGEQGNAQAVIATDDPGIAPGVYRHFKGNYYEVIGIARHSETEEAMVVYRALYGDGGLWTRPADMWLEMVEQDGQMLPRFHKLTLEERVQYYEGIFDELKAAADCNAADACFPAELKLKRRLLEAYYTSGQWQRDYEADENGLLPPDLKRGVLSQDGVFDLLEHLPGELE